MNENQIIFELLMEYINVNSKDNMNRTCLHLAVSKNNVDIIKLLISAGANLNIMSLSGETALVKAVKSNHISSVKLLLRYGADLEIIYKNSIYSENVIKLCERLQNVEAFKLIQIYLEIRLKLRYLWTSYKIDQNKNQKDKSFCSYISNNSLKKLTALIIP